MPHEITNNIVGDMIYIENGVDLDNIEFTWGGALATALDH
jgi:hypothetical protein